MVSTNNFTNFPLYLLYCLLSFLYPIVIIQHFYFISKYTTNYILVYRTSSSGRPVIILYLYKNMLITNYINIVNSSGRTAFIIKYYYKNNYLIKLNVVLLGAYYYNVFNHLKTMLKN